MAVHTTRRKTRLLGDMTNKLREPNTSTTVYHEIRVDKEIPDDIGALGKLRLIYNGISANAWLTPVGIRHVKQSRTTYNNHGDALPNELKNSSLSNELKNSIRDRAVSASGIMGRRHFELDRQELGKGEMILGVKMGEKKDTESSLRIGTGMKLSSDGKERRRSRLHPGFERRIKTADPKSVKGSELPDLTITQMVNVNNSSRTEPEKRDDLAPNNTPVETKKRVKILDDDIPGFKSVEAMHEAYKTRTKSAPLRNLEKDKDLVRSATSMQECHPSYRGPTLKPLLGFESKDDDKADCCNGACKGCFRACLASDDYFEKGRFNEGHQRPSLIRVPRRQISYRLRPALRMAFLEQLAISKEPQSRETKKDSHDNTAENKS